MLAVGVRVLLACLLGTWIGSSVWPCHKSAHDEEVLLRGVRDVAAAFARHGVEATLSSGSLLGAVRDGQFIQDDADADLDVCLHPAGLGLPPGVSHKQALLAWVRNHTQFRAELGRLGWEQSTFRPDRLLPVGLGGYRTTVWGIAKVCTKHFLCRPPRIDMLATTCPLAFLFPSQVSPDVSLPVSRAPSATRFHPRVPKYVAEYLDMYYGGDWHIPKPQLPLAGCGITQRWLSMWVAATLLLDALLVAQRHEQQATRCAACPQRCCSIPCSHLGVCVCAAVWLWLGGCVDWQTRWWRVVKPLLVGAACTPSQEPSLCSWGSIHHLHGLVRPAVECCAGGCLSDQ